jgi:hypothetical protein
MNIVDILLGINCIAFALHSFGYLCYPEKVVYSFFEKVEFVQPMRMLFWGMGGFTITLLVFGLGTFFLAPDLKKQVLAILSVSHFFQVSMEVISFRAQLTTFKKVMNILPYDLAVGVANLIVYFS